MKPWSAILIAILLSSTATAQVASWDDDAGDQTVQYVVTRGDGNTYEDIPNDDLGWYPNFDIIRAGILEETANEITFDILLSSDDYEGTEVERPYLIVYNVYFKFHDEPMRIQFYDYEWLSVPYGWGERLEGDYWQTMGNMYVDVEPHPEGPGWTATVDKLQLRDIQLVPAREGDTISDVWATAGRSEWDWGGGIVFSGICPDQANPNDFGGRGCGIQMYDYAGDDASVLGSYELALSPEGVGNILLEVERPFRASNGLATTYVYETRLINLADAADTVSLAALNVPSGWDVYLPPRVDLEPNEVKDIRMAIGVPFGHKHGETEFMEIHAKSLNDPENVAEAFVAVSWPEIAQPSGHHPRLHFHAAGYQRWMNTASEDAQSDGTGIVGAYDWSCGVVQLCIQGDLENPTGFSDDLYYHNYHWLMYLRPGLFTGLDFELENPITGNLDISIQETIDATVITELVLYEAYSDEPTVIGSQSQVVSFVAGQETGVPVSMTVAPEADRIAFAPNSNLYFLVEIEASTNDPAEYDALTMNNLFYVGLSDRDYGGELYSSGSFLDLPLLDYHDDVDQGLLDDLTRLQLEAPEDIFRAVNPGKTVAYFFEVINKGSEDDTIEWHVEGPLADWAEVVPGFSKVDATGKATVAIRVDAPLDAQQDDVADLLLVGQSTNDPDAQVFGNFQAYVETNAEIPDESDRFVGLMETAEENEAKGAPFPAGILMVGLALAAMVMRRRV